MWNVSMWDFNSVIASLFILSKSRLLHVWIWPTFAVLLISLQFIGLVRYNENIVMDPGTVDIYPSSRIPKNLHYLVKPIYCSKSLITKDLSGSGDTLKEKGFRITTNPQTLTSVLQFSSDDEVVSIQWFRSLPGILILVVRVTHRSY